MKWWYVCWTSNVTSVSGTAFLLWVYSLCLCHCDIQCSAIRCVPCLNSLRFCCILHCERSSLMTLLSCIWSSLCLYFWYGTLNSFLLHRLVQRHNFTDRFRATWWILWYHTVTVKGSVKNCHHPVNRNPLKYPLLFSLTPPRVPPTDSIWAMMVVWR